jgi:CRP-like cAMP-binding protein
MAEPASGAVPVELMLMVRSFLGGLTDAMPGPVVRQFAAMTRELFFREDHIYFVVQGEVALETAGHDPWRFGNYSALGILDAYLERPHTRTATAARDTRALVLRSEDWMSLMEDNFELTRLALGRNARGVWQMAIGLADEAFDQLEVPERSSQVTALARRSEARLGMLNPFERLLVLRLSPLLRRARMQPLIRLARDSEVRFLEQGQVLFQQADPTVALYFVVSGLVRVERLEPVVSGTFHATQLVGGYASLTFEEHGFSASAVTDSVVLEVAVDDLFDVMEDHYDVVHSLQAYLAEARVRVQSVKAPDLA